MSKQLPQYEAVNLNDLLPEYKPTLHTFDIVSWKKELQSPFKTANDRSWNFAIVELNSTQLNIYQFNHLSAISSFLNQLTDSSHTIHQSKPSKLSANSLLKFLTTKGTSSIPFDIIKPYLGQLKKSYTLQGSKFGSAVDYHKRAFTLRLRCELNQFLLSFLNLKRFVNFFADLKTCKELSLPIDERKCLKFYKNVSFEISGFRGENFDKNYTSIDKNNEHLTIFKKNTIEFTHMKQQTNSEENQLFTENQIPEKPRILSEDVDENVIFSLTCIEELEARNSWKGEIVFTGNFSNSRLARFQTNVDKHSNKLIVDVEKFEHFRKLVNYKTNEKLRIQQTNCKKFKMIGCKLVEENHYSI